MCEDSKKSKRFDISMIFNVLDLFFFSDVFFVYFGIDPG